LLSISIVLFILYDLKAEAYDITEFLPYCYYVHNLFSDNSLTSVDSDPKLL